MNSSCIFGIAILSSKAKCQYSKKEYIGEKELLSCTNIEKQKECSCIYNFLCENSKFIINNFDNRLNLIQKNKISIGGLLALNEITDNNEIIDIISLLSSLNTKYKNLEDLPIKQIITTISKYKPRN